MTENKLRSVLSGLLFPPKCCACGEFLREHILDTEPRALCESCRRKWEYAKLSACQRCGEELSACRCMPPMLRRAGVAVALKMVSYNKVRNTTVKRCIIYMKRKNTRVVFDFFSKQLAGLLLAYLEETYTSRRTYWSPICPEGAKTRSKAVWISRSFWQRALAGHSGATSLGFWSEPKDGKRSKSIWTKRQGRKT